MNKVRKEAPGKAKAPKVRATRETGLAFMGVLAALGFLIGLAWPKVAGVKLIPEAPDDEFRVPATASAEVVKAPAPRGSSEKSEPVLPSSETLEVSRAEITSCQAKRGRAQKSCGELDVDPLLLPRLLMLDSCPERAGASGTLSLGIELDFEHRVVEKVRAGVSTTLPNPVRDGLLACAKKNLASLKLGSETLPYDHYTVFYRIAFRLAGAEKGEMKDAAIVKPASGEVVVRWPTALVRKDADRESDVVLKVRSGARLKVTGRSGDWLAVEISEGGKKKAGFIHGAAVGESRSDVLDPSP